MNRSLTTSVLLTAAMGATPALADSFTDFEGFTTGVSVDGQGGWVSTGTWDEEVVDDGTGNTVWRVSNAVTSGAFGNQPHSPLNGGVPTDTVTDPDNSMPGEFAGESSTGALNNQFIGSFKFKAATGAPQPGMSVTVSADNGSGGRQGFIDIEESSVATSGLDIQTFDVDSGGNFVAVPPIATGLAYDEWHEFKLEIDFIDGPDNDVARYYVNGSLVHTAQSWEQYYSNFEAANHPLGVPVQSFMYRLSGGAVPGVDGGGLYIDDVSVALVPEPATMALMGLGGVCMLARRRKA